MSHDHDAPAVDEDGMPTDPLYAHVMGGQMGICYLLTIGGCGLLLGRYGFPLAIWLLTLPISAYVCLMQARRLKRSPWLALACAPFPPLSLWLFNRLAAPTAEPAPEAPTLPVPPSTSSDDRGSSGRDMTIR